MEAQYISLNMTPTGVNPCFHISQYDVGRMLGFIVHSGGATVDLDTYTCTVEATRSDGTAITSAVATTDNIGTFEVTPTMSNKTDKYRCQLVIVDANSKRIASLPFDMDVCKAAMDENSESIEEDASLYQQYTEAVQGAIAEANADIQVEENARIAAVNAEATARQNADAALQNNIDAEATARQTADNTLQGNINSEASARASADSNLQSQINQIVAPSGEAPSAAEVTNARIGINNVNYASLGDAVRTQVGNLMSDVQRSSAYLSDISSYLTPVVFEIGSINTNTGAFVNSSDGTRIRSNTHIPCKSNTVYRFHVENNTGNAIVLWLLYYDFGKGFISETHINIANGDTFDVDKTTPSNAEYIAIRIDGTGLTPTSVPFNAFTYNSQKYNTLINYGNITTSGLDLNTGDFIRAGMWSLADKANKPSNYPSNLTGRIISFASASGSSFSTMQMVIDSDNVMYFRYSMSNGIWADWSEVADFEKISSLSMLCYGNIETAGLDLNGGDFIHPGVWAVNKTAYLPKNIPTNKRCRIISYASNTNNTIYTLQIVVDADGEYYSRFSTTTNTWTSWIKWNAYKAQAFETLYTEHEPFINNYDIQRLTASTPNKVSKLYELIDAVTSTGITITKDNLGKDASNEFNIFNYKVSLNTGEKPVVLLVCGEHGNELTSAYIGYYLYKEIVEGALTKYLNYVDFWYVPLMNPYGYENNLRNNANDVNLNRDFPCEWVYSIDSHNKTGNYSLSQVESQYIYNLIVNNKDKILFICNKHDTGGIAKKIATSQEDIVGYVSTALQSDKIVNNGIAKWQNAQVRKTDSWIIDDCTENINSYNLIASCSYVTSGSLDLFANSIGIHGSLLEIAGASYFTDDGYIYYPVGEFHFKDLARLGLDFFVNYISSTIEKNSKVLKNDKIIPSNLRYYTRKQIEGTWTTIEQYWNGATLVDIN